MSTRLGPDRRHVLWSDCRAQVTGGGRCRRPLASGATFREAPRPPLVRPEVVVSRAARSAAAKARARRRGPRWARLCAAFGALLTMLSGGLLVGGEILLARYEGAVAQENLFDADTAPPKSDVKGPLNL